MGDHRAVSRESLLRELSILAKAHWEKFSLLRTHSVSSQYVPQANYRVLMQTKDLRDVAARSATSDMVLSMGEVLDEVPSRRRQERASSLFLTTSLGSGLGDLAGASGGLLDSLDDTDGDGLTHVTDGETTEGRVVGESLNAHGLGGNHLDDGGIAGLDELGVDLGGLASSAIDLLEDLGELARNVGSVAVKDGSVTSTDLAGVVEDDNLGGEGSGTKGGVVLGVTSDVATADFLDGDVLHVEADVVTGDTLAKLLVVHLDGLDFSGDVGGSEGDDHTGLEDTSLDTADGHSSNTTDLVDILEGKTEGLVCGTLGHLNGINGIEKGLAGNLAGLDLLLPALVPGAVGGDLKHVVAVEARDGDESDSLGVVANLLDEVGSLLDDLVETILGPVGGVHLVDGNDELLDTEGVGEQSVLTGLAILGDTSLELTSTGGNDENSAIGLGSTSNHVLDEVTVTGGICREAQTLAGCCALARTPTSREKNLPMTVT